MLYIGYPHKPYPRVTGVVPWPIRSWTSLEPYPRVTGVVPTKLGKPEIPEPYPRVTGVVLRRVQLSRAVLRLIPV